MPRKTFVAGEILTASDVNEYLGDQAVMVFDDATARDAAISSPVEGMVVFLKDSDTLQKRTATDWRSVTSSLDMPAGIVLQVLSAQRLTTVSTTSTSLVDYTDLSVTITPRSTSSKIVLSFVSQGSQSVQGQFNYAQFDRGGSSIGGEIGFNSWANNSGVSVMANQWVDSPATASATTYKVRIRVSGGTGTYSNAQFIVMEVAG